MSGVTWLWCRGGTLHSDSSLFIGLGSHIRATWIVQVASLWCPARGTSCFLGYNFGRSWRRLLVSDKSGCLWSLFERAGRWTPSHSRNILDPEWSSEGTAYGGHIFGYSTLIPKQLRGPLFVAYFLGPMFRARDSTSLIHVMGLMQLCYILWLGHLTNQT